MLGVNELKQAFNQLDKDGSGYLEVEEVVALSKSLGEEVTKENITSLFSEADTNKDGKLSFNEFVAWFRVGRTTRFAKLMKYQISMLSKFDDFTNKMSELEKQFGTSEEDAEIIKLANIVFKDAKNDPGKTSVKLDIRTGMKNHMTKALKYAFPNYDEETMYVYFTLRSEKSHILKKRFNTFISELMLIIEQAAPQLMPIVGMIDFQVSQLNDKVVVLVNPAQCIAAVTGAELITTILDEVNKAKVDLSFKFRTGIDFERFVNDSKSALSKQTMNEEERNLITKFLEGIYLSFTAGLAPQYKDILLGMYESLKENIPKNMLSKHVDEYTDKIKTEIISGIYDINDIEQLQKFIKGLVSNGKGNLPMSTDLVDFIGVNYEKLDSITTHLPCIADFIEALREFAVFDAEAGIVHSKALLSLGVGSVGLSSLYDFLNERME